MSKWEFVELSKLCDLEKGKTGLLKAKDGKYPLVATGKNRRTCDTYQFDTKAVCIPLVSSTGHGHASLKYVHYQEGKFALGTILVAVIPKDKNILNAQFLHLYLSRLKDSILVPLMTGAANVTLTVTKLKTVKIPLPQIEEQLRIVSLFNRMDNKQAELTNEIQTQQTLLKKLRQAILQEAIEGKLTASWREQNPDVESVLVLLEKIKAEKEQLIKEKKIKKQKTLPPISDDEKPFEIPDSWVWCRLGSIISKIGSGSTPRGSNYSEKGIPFFRSQNIHDNGLVYNDIKYISDETHIKMSGTKVLPEDILLNITGGSMGRCAYVPKDFKDANLSQHVCIIRPILINPIFLHKLVLSPNFQDMIFSSTTGAGREGLPKNNLEQFPIPIIPLEEQQKIVKKIENLFTICDKLEEQINNSKINSQILMQAVLKEAFESKEDLTIDEEAMIMMSYIIDSMKPNELGRVKLQKIISMHVSANNVNYGFEFKKCAMGPYDKKRMEELETKIEEVRWFKKYQENGEKGRIYYTPLEQKDKYREKLTNLPYKKELENIINIMRPLSLSQSEIVATLYAVYLEEKKSSLIGAYDKVIIAKAKEWHEAKQQYVEKDWRWGINWLKSNGFILLDD